MNQWLAASAVLNKLRSLRIFKALFEIEIIVCNISESNDLCFHNVTLTYTSLRTKAMELDYLGKLYSCNHWLALNKYASADIQPRQYQSHCLMKEWYINYLKYIISQHVTPIMCNKTTKAHVYHISKSIYTGNASKKLVTEIS